MSEKLGAVSRKDVENHMNQLLQRLSLHFKVEWIPDPTKKNYGNIDLTQRIIHIHDTNETEAWTTLTHEALELKLKPLLSFYRNLVNLLIDFLEKEAYARKEKFLESLPMILSEFEKAKKDSDIE